MLGKAAALDLVFGAVARNLKTVAGATGMAQALATAGIVFDIREGVGITVGYFGKSGAMGVHQAKVLIASNQVQIGNRFHGKLRFVDLVMEFAGFRTDLR
jgi:hypothetical protein